MQPTKVFPVNNVTWARANRGSNLIIPVPCCDVAHGPINMRFFPATFTQFNDMHVADYSSFQWRRLLVQDVDLGEQGRELPLWVRRPADAYMVAERYATAVNAYAAGHPHGLNRADWQAVSHWTLSLAMQHPGQVESIEAWLYKPPPGDLQGPPTHA